jgi:hypothetical protein
MIKPAQTKRLDSDESRLTPPPRLTESEIHGIHYIESECREQPSPMMFARAIETAVRKQLGVKDQEGGAA